MSFYVGNYKGDAQDPEPHGWIVGTFMDGTRKRDELEIKYWEFGLGDNSHLPKTSSIVECTLILTGKGEAIIGDQKITIQAGDYVVIEPNTPNNLIFNVLDAMSGITIKAPSDPSAKQILKDIG